MKSHDAYCGHNPIPMGCDCGRSERRTAVKCKRCNANILIGRHEEHPGLCWQCREDDAFVPPNTEVSDRPADPTK